MTAKKYADAAIVALQAYLKGTLANFSDGAIVKRLRQLEIDQGLAPGAMPNPVKIIRARAPFDSTSPLISIFSTAGKMIDQRQRFASIDANVVITLNGGVDLEQLEDTIRRYHSAMIDALALSNEGTTTPWGGASGVSGLIITDWDDAPVVGDRAATRIATAIGVQMRMHTP